MKKPNEYYSKAPTIYSSKNKNNTVVICYAKNKEEVYKKIAQLHSVKIQWSV